MLWASHVMIQTLIFKDWPLAKAFYIHPSISMHNGCFKKCSKTETFSGLQLDQTGMLVLFQWNKCAKYSWDLVTKFQADGA